MATTNSPSTFPGLFKEVYGSKVEELVPNFAILQKSIEFSEEEMTGDSYVVAVNLQNEQGFSYGPSSGGNTILTLNASVAGYIGRAKVEGYQIVLRSRLDYPAASKAATKGKRAVDSAYGALVENMIRSHRKRLELCLLYGQRGIGEVLTNVSGVLTIKVATWAPGIWTGMKDAVLTAWTTQADVSTQHDGDLVVSSIDISARTVTVTGTSTAVVAADHLYFKGTRTASGFNECAGLDKIILNTGNLFNIDAAAFELWKGNSFAVAGDLSQAKVIAGTNLAVAMGLDEDATLFVSPRTFGKLMTDQAALRQYDRSYDKSKGVNGFEKLCFANTNGTLEVVSHPMVKEGESFLAPLEKCKRVGSTDITNRLPGTEDLVLHVQDANAYEIRSYSDQGLVALYPAQCVKFTGIVNS